VRSLVILLLLAGGCGAIRASSRDHLPPAASRVVLPGPADGVVPRVIAAFARRGFAVVDRRVDRAVTVLKFKGARATVTVVTTGAYGMVSGSSSSLGSVFYARLLPSPAGTEIDLIGKPTVDGKEVCSDADAGLDRCSEVVTGLLWPGRRQATGKEEAEQIRGVLVELDLEAPGRAPPDVVATF
jgi:hypothetical protein